MSAALILGALVTWWFPAGPTSAVDVSSQLIAELARVAPEDASPLLTEIYDNLAKDGRADQVLLLQAVPGEAPLVVATAEDSSDEEEATHWPSPWSAVNSALESGSIPARTTITGRRAGFDYLHTLIPVDQTYSRVLLINQAAPAPRWGMRRILLLLAGTALLTCLFACRE